MQIEKEALREKLREENAKQTRIRREILDSADIICTTLSGAGSESLKNDLQSDRRLVSCLAYVKESLLFVFTNIVFSCFVGVSALSVVLLLTR